ncbi:hypothetical protein ATCV1_z240L [Acanthocystis turfacea chlorella virus 1]|uniref:Uncharacterized protein z240L n=1 Tax=Chlorovirus heliozoae TaxID=322019 RepID=A7K8K0_9PHYC|nr:hypothetical protein ATCV1_z240L [Acanthocystis turfacea chlorella virus 1]ABT16374.1 hypothetical protein ATCV1_z240L [Acanthocystis turfacea chlorella virus 1]
MVFNSAFCLEMTPASADVLLFTLSLEDFTVPTNAEDAVVVADDPIPDSTAVFKRSAFCWRYSASASFSALSLCCIR